jgi:hypothetical protein
LKYYEKVKNGVGEGMYEYGGIYIGD